MATDGRSLGFSAKAVGEIIERTTTVIESAKAENDLLLGVLRRVHAMLRAGASQAALEFLDGYLAGRAERERSKGGD